MPLPLDVRDLMRSGTRLTEERERPVRIAVFVEVDARDELISAVQAALRPRTSAASLHVDVAEPDAVPALGPATDVVIAIAGSGTAGLYRALEAPRRAQTPVVVLSVGSDGHAEALADALAQPTADIVVSEEAAAAVERLGAWLADALGSKRLALAHNFAFMRRAVAEDAIKTTAWQNGLIGTVSLIPGADMPIMTANQAKMLLQIAAAYGEPLGVDRMKELAAVVGGGFALRTIARQALVAVPVLGWAIKGGIGYTGTMAMGKAAVAYFEEGVDFHQVTERLKKFRNGAMERIPKRRRAGLRGAATTPELSAVVADPEYGGAADGPGRPGAADGPVLTGAGAQLALPEGEGGPGDA